MLHCCSISNLMFKSSMVDVYAINSENFWTSTSLTNTHLEYLVRLEQHMYDDLHTSYHIVNKAILLKLRVLLDEFGHLKVVTKEQRQIIMITNIGRGLRLDSLELISYLFAERSGGYLSNILLWSRGWGCGYVWGTFILQLVHVFCVH